MYKALQLFLLVCLLGIIAIVSTAGTAAQAGAITGMVGVGTYNTQADFANLTVTQGNTTLYQSNFAAGMAEWKTLSGTWSTTTDGILHQTGADTPALALVGDPNWTNYTLTLKARKTGGAEGFLITFGSPGDTTKTWWNIGGWGNTRANLQVPGVQVADVGGSVQTGVWYDIKIEVLRGTDIRCYLNGTLIHDTARILDAGERTTRFQELQASPGFSLLNGPAQTWLTDLAGRSVYVGQAARDTFSAMPSTTTFNTLSASQQAAIIRQVNRHRLTWVTGGGFGSDAGRDAGIIASVDAAVTLHNQLGLFDMQLTANNSPGTPTADASYGGWMRFGSQYALSTALHEISHSLGTGTYWKWSQLMVGGLWQGAYTNTQLSAFDGAGSVLHGDTQHYWPYGMNYDTEYSVTNAYRHVLLVAALRRDMGIATLDVQGSTDIADGTYALVPRNAPGSVLDVLGSNAGAGTAMDIHSYTGADNQRFLLDLQSDGSYRIRTALSGNRALDLPNADASNGNNLWIWDDNGLDPQRWYIIPTGDGWYRIAPKLNVYKTMDIVNVATADGSRVDLWDYLDNFGQQWKFVPASQLYSTSVANGTYRLMPQNAPGSALEVPNASGAAGTAMDIHAYTGADGQKFLLDVQSDGTYRIRTALAGNRALDLLNGDTTNGSKVQIFDDTGLDTQRWYLIPVQNGWYKLAPKLNIDKSLDVSNSGTADGTAVDNWDYLGGPNQLWSLTAPPPPAVTTLTPSKVVAGNPAFTLTVTGSYFTAASSVLWNGTALPTTFVSATQLTAAVPASAVATAGTRTVTVTGAATPAYFTVTATGTALPTVTAISPAKTVAGSPAFKLTVTGSYFTASTPVLWNGTALPTTFVSATQLTATVPATAVASVGTSTVTVAGAATSATFTVTAPLPVVTTLSPAKVIAGSPAFTLTITGSYFTAAASVLWNGSALPTTFVSATQLTAAVPASAVTKVGTRTVTVTGASTPATFTVTAPPPVVTALSPSQVVAGSPAFILKVTGTNFTASTPVLWNGTALPTTFVSTTQMTATVPATAVAAVGTSTVTAAGGSISATFTVIAPVPTVTALSPARIVAGSLPFKLTVTGTHFTASTPVLWNGSALPTTFVSATQLTAMVPAAAVASVGTSTVTVAGAANALTFAVFGNNAAFVSQSMPNTMVAGQSYSISITYRNTGYSTWTSGMQYELGSQNPTDNATWGTGRAALAASVAPGQTGTFTFTITAPSTVGNYNFQWQMLQEGVEWFGAKTPNVVVPVGAPAAGTVGNNATFVSQVVPATMAAGKSYNVSVTLKNTGSTTWTEGSLYRLGSQSPQDNFTWGLYRAYLPKPVAPGDTVTIPFTVKAPAKAGSYDFQWKMVQEMVQFFGAPTTDVKVNVQ